MILHSQRDLGGSQVETQDAVVVYFGVGKFDRGWQIDAVLADEAEGVNLLLTAAARNQHRIGVTHGFAGRLQPDPAVSAVEEQ